MFCITAVRGYGIGAASDCRFAPEPVPPTLVHRYKDRYRARIPLSSLSTMAPKKEKAPKAASSSKTKEKEEQVKEPKKTRVKAEKGAAGLKNLVRPDRDCARHVH